MFYKVVRCGSYHHESILKNQVPVGWSGMRPIELNRHIHTSLVDAVQAFLKVWSSHNPVTGEMYKNVLCKSTGTTIGEPKWKVVGEPFTDYPISQVLSNIFQASNATE